MPRTGKHVETENNLTIARGKGQRAKGMESVYLVGMEHSGVTASFEHTGGRTHREGSECYRGVHFQGANSTPCTFHLNKNIYSCIHGVNLYNKNKISLKVFLLQLLPVPFFMWSQLARFHGKYFREFSPSDS